MSDIKDDRFKHIANDPRFRSLPKKEKKIKIDKRFKSMFNDDRFKVKYSVDKRGRPITLTSSENLKDYYELPSDEEDSGEDRERDLSDKTDDSSKLSKKSKARKLGLHGTQNPETDSVPSKGKKILGDKGVNKQRNFSAQDESKDGNFGACEISSEGSQSESEGDDNRFLDLARGEGNVSSSSDDDASDSEGDYDDVNDDHNWGELDADANRSDDVTTRIAVCNMDWDRIKAVDLLVLLNSFKPAEAIIKSVKIYPSDYGVARLKEEEISGPKELVSKSDEELGLEEKEEGNKYHMEKLRKYQLNRLKYYYAVVECDSVNTANKLYEECDGLEYETSATRLDLRFIPDDVVFEQEPTSTADELPEFSSYQPTNFTTTALQQVKVDLTWDETNPDRMKTIQKTFDEKEEFGDDIKAYLASSSDEDDEDLVNDQSNCSDDKDGNHRSSIAKYKSLLLSIEEKDKKKADDDVEMEVSWEPGLKDTTEKMLGKKEKEKSMTPWDKFLEKKRDKRIQKMENKHRKESSGGEEQPFSDDDIPSDVDLKDNYFKEEFKDDGEKKSKKAREKKGSESVEDKKSKAELELLLMDNDDVEKKHFNMKSIIDKETGSKKRKKKNVKIDDDKDENDTFQVDVKDARFNALYTSHLFNIDPSDQQYKKTRGTDAIVEEKRKRRSNKSTDDVISKQSRTADKEDDGLSTLVRSVKNKAKNYNFKKEKKKIVK